jgi:hypothetical protein
LKYKDGAFELESVEFIASELMHQVIFRSLLARHYSWQYVKHSENTIPPMLDDVEGYYFAGWNKPYTNITENTEIEAVY